MFKLEQLTFVSPSKSDLVQFLLCCNEGSYNGVID